jgi:hypothetical protein
LLQTIAPVTGRGNFFLPANIFVSSTPTLIAGDTSLCAEFSTTKSFIPVTSALVIHSPNIRSLPQPNGIAAISKS